METGNYQDIDVSTTVEFPIPLQPVHKAHEEINDVLVLAETYVRSLAPISPRRKREATIFIDLLRRAENHLCSALETARNPLWYVSSSLPRGKSK